MKPPSLHLRVALIDWIIMRRVTGNGEEVGGVVGQARRRGVEDAWASVDLLSDGED